MTSSITTSRSPRPRHHRARGGAAMLLSVGLALGVAACDDGDANGPDPTLAERLQSDPDVPYDNDVSNLGDTPTNERSNQGFEPDAPGPVGNETNPNG